MRMRTFLAHSQWFISHSLATTREWLARARAGLPSTPAASIDACAIFRVNLKRLESELLP